MLWRMTRVTMDAFAEGTALVRVYLAARLAEGQAVERALDASGFEYVAEPEEFASPTALGSSGPRRGVGFWVEEGTAGASAEALERAGLVAGLVEP
jgi:hypothetical protein